MDTTIMLVEMTLPDNQGSYGVPGSTYKLIKYVRRTECGYYPVLPAMCIEWRPLNSDTYHSKVTK